MLVCTGLLVTVVLLVVVTWTIRTAWEQDARDAGLIAAIRRSDPDAVRLCLVNGANPDAGENLVINGSFWLRIKAFFMSKNVPRRDAQAISESKIIDYQKTHLDEGEPIKWRKLLAVYMLIGQAQCRKHPEACGAARKSELKAISKSLQSTQPP